MSKENTTFVNGMSPVTKESDGTVVGFPDVCRTPGGGGPIPVPYPNVAKSNSLKDGSRSVLINGAPVATSGSSLGRSTGNEGGTAGGGVSSGTTKGAAHPVSYSFDVRIEGKGVVRNFDLFTLNDHNTGPFPIVQANGAPPVGGIVDEVALAQLPDARCPHCHGEKHEVAKGGRTGTNLGNSAVLGRNMLEGRALLTHHWYAGAFSVAAHHLICVEAMASPTWGRICVDFGYHIDRKANGVFLPMRMALACHLGVAVHRGNHAEGHALELHLSYPDAVKRALDEVLEKVKSGTYCAKPDALLRKLDKLSSHILDQVRTFAWTLTRDGLDYSPGGVGCSGLRSIRQKPSGAMCPHERRHGLKHAVSGQPLSSRALTVGE
ncbi:DUF4150 domain-containing protein [Myxococcus llanfairpwllgwyngyllgogerychwyrndrobwllllantysiliogogogochensis]|uniref:DUF4150 domain-containing protein n=1 Tax=Myxococcus llanfairpwllgwyngyllgogerychwyrndrobwllllantysiliogogogochensis TaxID=2590453 RepID=A0A540WSR5_9BACT|nr:PAAR-like domain-containing protein [Myxococcus llanfairpwllgwyngyllgogerychwyrndrobwllllantysiliogogogochensis]TQF12000.1 DUF4150 domain-containing protein [Myxococcus llanfairpwllgwyngyllgogerychwyrndrobwllllantysiliogogogochensis]